jgi:hypothetical protein
MCFATVGGCYAGSVTQSFASEACDRVAKEWSVGARIDRVKKKLTGFNVGDKIEIFAVAIFTLWNMRSPYFQLTSGDGTVVLESKPIDKDKSQASYVVTGRHQDSELEFSLSAAVSYPLYSHLDTVSSAKCTSAQVR